MASHELPTGCTLNHPEPLAELSFFLTRELRRVDSQIARVNVASVQHCEPDDLPVNPPEAWEAVLRMTAAMAIAARAAGLKSKEVARQDFGGKDTEHLDQAKRSVDGAAVTAGEQVLGRSRAHIVVKAGEGIRDDSPGAQLDQVLGQDGSELHAVIDYVDGTGLAARGLPGALSLGALGSNIRRTPDLKAFAILAPRAVLAELGDWQSPTELALETLRAVAAARGVGVRDLRVLTHSRDVGAPQLSWYQFLEENAGEVVIPDPISVEPPYILTRATDSQSLQPKIDCLIGVMGLVELIYAALLLDLSAPDDAIHFRLVSGSSAKDLMAAPVKAFNLTERDLMWAETAGLDHWGRHSSDSFIPPGSALCATMFAVTANRALDLSPASENRVEGLLLLCGGQQLRVNIEY